VVFGLIALTLAAVGIYGLVLYSASQRYDEIAVRSAIGADRASVLKMFVGRGLWLAGLGVIGRPIFISPIRAITLSAVLSPRMCHTGRG